MKITFADCKIFVECSLSLSLVGHDNILWGCGEDWNVCTFRTCISLTSKYIDNNWRRLYTEKRGDDWNIELYTASSIAESWS